MPSGKKKNTSKSSRKVGCPAFSGIGDMDDNGSMVDNSIRVHGLGDEDKRVISNPSGAFSGIVNLDDNPSMVVNSIPVHHSHHAGVEHVIRGKNKLSKTGKRDCNVVVSEDVSGSNIHDKVEENKEDTEVKEDTVSITFTGKKKSSKKNATGLFSALLLNEEGDKDDVLLSESGSDALGVHSTLTEEKISVTGLTAVSGVVDSALVDMLSISVERNDSLCVSSTIETVDSESIRAAEALKKKKKKKKSVRTVQEEDDIDKILAELGEGPLTLKQPIAPVPTVALQEEKVQMLPEVEDGADAGENKGKVQGTVESVAAKKKKKKDRDKEKNASATVQTKYEKQEQKSELKGIVADKNIPKHVRLMQETLVKLKKAEDMKKKQVEDILRKEEEERRRQEELERQAEERKRLKKLKEKEKPLKKKTDKQKEQERRLEAMRKQYADAARGLPLPSGDTGGAKTKPPKYETKKSKPRTHVANGNAAVCRIESMEVELVGCHLEAASDLVRGKDDKLQENDAVEESGVKDEKDDTDDDDDDSWDVKSCWDDDHDIELPNKSTFLEEESSDSEFEPAVQKDVKCSEPVKSDVGSPCTKSTKNVTPSVPLSPHKVDLTDNTPEVEVPKSEDNHTSCKVDINLRAPICCIMGHVDTGKTKLLDCIRGTNVQEGEAGHITQQIGATYFPAENIRERVKELKADAKLSVPGLLVIDTPGHESFANLRSRGSGLCDLAVLVVDIMHGLKPQTIESLNLLKMRGTHFIVALNKVDKLYGWKPIRNAPICKTMKQQSKDVLIEFQSRVNQVVTQLKEQGINSELYYKIKNKERGDTVSIVPTSAISGEGVPDLLLVLAQWAPKTMIERLTYSNELQCTVLEVKVVEGHGTTIDVVLVNGVLHEGDQIVVCGMQGPIGASIRELLTPRPMREIRVKGAYVHHKEIKAVQCIKISAQGLEHAIAGTGLYVVGPDDDLDSIKEKAMEEKSSVMNKIDKSGNGVCVQASTLGSLEALLELLKTLGVNIPVSRISIGPVHKKDVDMASVMLEKKKEFATILALDVTVTSEAKELSEARGVKIFCADTIFRLCNQFKAYIDNLEEEKKKEAAEEAVFPCVLRIENDIHKKDPIVLAVEVVEGTAKAGTPICVPQKEFIEIGRIESIENNHKPVDLAQKGQKVCIKIVGSNSEEKKKMFGRHFKKEDELVSRISRRSIDVLKEYYRDDLSIEEWTLLLKLKKKIFKIQ